MWIGGQFHPPHVTDGDALKSGVEAHILAKGLEAWCLLHLVDRVILNDAAVLDPLEHLSCAHTGAWAADEYFIAGRGPAPRRGLAVADRRTGAAARGVSRCFLGYRNRASIEHGVDELMAHHASPFAANARVRASFAPEAAHVIADWPGACGCAPIASKTCPRASEAKLIAPVSHQALGKRRADRICLVVQWFKTTSRPTRSSAP